jgi:hypothetical protein
VVVAGVACLPVLVLGAGATLHHLLGDTTPADEPATGAEDGAVAARVESAEVARPAAPGQAIEQAPALPPVRRKPVAKSGRGKPAPRRLLGDYLDEARAQLVPGIDPSPAWCRRVTGCSAGTSVNLSRALRTELHTAPNGHEQEGRAA